MTQEAHFYRVVAVEEHEIRVAVEMHFYRISDYLADDGVHVTAEVWRAIKETECGHWIVKQGEWSTLEINGGYWTWEQARKRKVIRWTAKGDNRKCYCYPTLEKAMRNYQVRKHWQMHHLTTAIQKCQLAMDSVDLLKTKTIQDLGHWSGVNIGKIPAIDNYIWD